MWCVWEREPESEEAVTMPISYTIRFFLFFIFSRSIHMVISGTGSRLWQSQAVSLILSSDTFSTADCRLQRQTWFEYGERVCVFDFNVIKMQ